MTSGSIETAGSPVAGGPPNEPRGLRERKKRATRQALHSAALRLVADRGFDAVTIEDIVAAADVSPRTFFNYFGSKEDVIVNPDPDRVDRLRQSLGATPNDQPPLAVLRQVLRRQVADIDDQRDEWLLRLQLVRDTPALIPRYLGSFTSLERVLAEDVARRTRSDVDRDLYPMLVASTAMAALRSAFWRWRQAGGTTPIDVLVDSAFAAIEAGLPVPDQD